MFRVFVVIQFFNRFELISINFGRVCVRLSLKNVRMKRCLLRRIDVGCRRHEEFDALPLILLMVLLIDITCIGSL